MPSPTTHALANKSRTATWLKTTQSAVMAQLDEQIRGAAQGLIPGDKNPQPLSDWIARTYGALPDVDVSPTLPPAARQAARVRHWQADRLNQSATLLVTGEPQAVAHRLAQTGGFLSTPALPDSILEPRLTLVWAENHTGPSTYQVASPGAVDEESRCCAITIDQTTRRRIEWTPAPSLESLGPDLTRMTKQAGGDIPPWMVGGDSSYTPLSETVEWHQKHLMASAAAPPEEDDPLLTEQANAVLSAVTAGLFSLTRSRHGGEVVYTLGPPEP